MTDVKLRLRGGRTSDSADVVLEGYESGVKSIVRYARSLQSR